MIINKFDKLIARYFLKLICAKRIETGKTGQKNWKHYSSVLLSCKDLVPARPSHTCQVSPHVWRLLFVEVSIRFRYSLNEFDWNEWMKILLYENRKIAQKIRSTTSSQWTAFRLLHGVTPGKWPIMCKTIASDECKKAINWISHSISHA